MTRSIPAIAACFAAALVFAGPRAAAQEVSLDRIPTPASAARTPDLFVAPTLLRPAQPQENLVQPPAEATAPRQEALIGKPNFIRIADLDPNDPNVKLSRKVGQIIIFEDDKPAGVCSGFLIGPAIFMTNYHCAVDMETATPRRPEELLILMEHLREGEFGPKESRAFTKAVVKSDLLLDYAVLLLSAPLGERYGWLELETKPAQVKAASNVKIIQHPAGRPKEIVLEDTQMKEVGVLSMHYLADTEGGSSGSPVFDLNGTRVIGLHHKGWANKYNSGLNMPRIAAEIALYLPEGSSPQATAGQGEASPLNALSRQPAPVSAAERQQPATLGLPRRTDGTQQRQQPAQQQPAAQQPENFGVGAGTNRGDGSTTTIKLNWE